MRKAIAVCGVSLLLVSGLTAFGGQSGEQILRKTLLDHPVGADLGGDTSRPLVAQNAFSFQAANAPRRHQRPFSFGNRLFNTNWVEAPASVRKFDGLGPLFNRVSCSGCHTKDGRGAPPESGVGPMETMLFRISFPGKAENGGPNPVPGYGDQLSERANQGVPPEGIASITYTEQPGTYGDGTGYSLRQPTYAISKPAYGPLPQNLLLSPRVAPQMIGLGLLEAIPDETLQALADPDDSNGDGISGRMNQVWNSTTQLHDIGRFGWKAGQPDLRNQNAAAALGDIGLTTSLHRANNCEANQLQCREAQHGGEPEIEDAFLDKLTLYTATLAVPSQREASNPITIQGMALFRTFGCANCHLPTQQSGPHPLPELAHQTFHPFTDLLLHDMGEGLADNRPEFEASGSEWRTPPLWGLGLVPLVNGHDKLMQDGRARGFAEAILWHGGEAEAAKEAFRTAPKQERDALIAFLKSL